MIVVVQTMFVRYGGVLHDSEKMVKLVSSQQQVAVETVKQVDFDQSHLTNKYTGRSVVICAGTWAPKLLQSIGLNLPLQVCGTF